MKQCFFILFSSLIMTLGLQAQLHTWNGLLHGIHPITVELEKKGTWVVGQLYAAQDTFELEGSWNGNKIELLEFHDGLWTAKIKLEKKENTWRGLWMPRTESDPFLVELMPVKKQELRYNWIRPEKGLKYLSMSPVSGLDYFGHTQAEDSDSLNYFYYNPIIPDKFIGLHERDLKNQLITKLDSKSEKINSSWPVRNYAEADYHSLIEVFLPHTQAEKVDSVLQKWKNDFVQRLQFQKTDLVIKKDQVDWDKNRWFWNAYAYVEVYSVTEKCWSFALHSIDLKGRTEVESLHYFPHKDELFFLKTEFRNWGKLKEAMTDSEKAWDEWIFHPHGIVAIRSFSEKHGIERRFLEDKEIKKYYRFFSPLRWIE